MRVSGIGARRKIDRKNQFVGLEIRIDMRRRSGKAVHFVKLDGSLSFCASNPHSGIERRQRYTHIRRMCRNAVAAGAENGMNAIEAVNCAAAAAGSALVALWKSGICEVITPRPLKKISGVRRQ